MYFAVRLCRRLQLYKKANCLLIICVIIIQISADIGLYVVINVIINRQTNGQTNNIQWQYGVYREIGLNR